MTAWPPVRMRIAALAILSAAFTAAGAMAMDVGRVSGVVAYVAIAVLALVFPLAITVQVIGGLVIAGSVLARDGSAILQVVPLIAGIIATAELLAIAGRVSTPLGHDPRVDLRRAALAIVIGSGAFGAVALVGRLPGPTGLAAIALASVACFGIAHVLVRNAD